MATEVKLPELGEGIDSGDVLEVLVHEGDVIEKDQSIIELETDKATVEVPSTHAGKVTKVHVSSGDTVPVGGTLLTVEAVESDAPEAAPADSPSESETPAAQQEEPPAEKPEPQPQSQPPVEKEQAKAKPPAEPPGTATPTTQPSKTSASAGVAEDDDPDEMPSGDDVAIAAGPAVRRFAREVGVDLSTVEGSGGGGRITREDVLAVVRLTSKAARGSTSQKAGGNAATDKWGTVQIDKMPKIRRTIATKMLESWTSAPRVTNFDDADVTELERIRQSTRHDYQEKGIRLTTMPFIIKACAIALRDHPAMNASIDLEEATITYKQYYNIGIAIDTNRGLVVPNLRDADKMSIPNMARELAKMAEKVRAGDFTIDELRGGTFTISNLGAIGGTYSTPIINVPEVAILLVGRARKMPVVINDQIAIRLMMPLSLSYDHRLVDGATAARFLNDVIAYLEAPSRILLAP